MREDEIPNPSHSTFSTLGMNELKALKRTMLEYVRVFRSLEDFGVMMESLAELNNRNNVEAKEGNNDLDATGKSKGAT